jgi:membrane fusion protein (multidrug efflux system)
MKLLMLTSKRTRLITIGIVFISLYFFFFSKDQTPPINQGPKADVFIVGEPKDMAIDLTYPARIKAAKEVTIMARVSGVLEEKAYTEGAIVHKGDLLYKIEPEIYEAAFKSAQATLHLVNAKRAQTKKEWERAEKLYKTKSISEQAKDSAYFAYEEAKAAVDVATAQLQQASVNLAYTEVKATIDGIIGIKEVDVGDYVPEGTPLVKIIQTNPMLVEFSIPHIQTMRAKYALEGNGNWNDLQNAGLKGSLVVDGAPYQRVGTIDFIDTNIDLSTSTLKARATFDNPNGRLIAGGFATLKLQGVILKNGIAVPQKAVLQNPLGTIVFVLIDGKVAVKPVTIADTSKENFIVTGLAPKDVVIVNNFFRIKPGMSIQIDKTLQP